MSLRRLLSTVAAPAPAASRAVVAQKGPFEVQAEVGKKLFWCACGLSKKQPW